MDTENSVQLIMGKRCKLSTFFSLKQIIPGRLYKNHYTRMIILKQCETSQFSGL